MRPVDRDDCQSVVDLEVDHRGVLRRSPMRYWHSRFGRISSPCVSTVAERRGGAVRTPCESSRYELARHYVEQGWWTSETLGAMLARRTRGESRRRFPRALGAAAVARARSATSRSWRGGSRRVCGGGASAPATSSRCSCPTGWRPPPPSGRRRSSARWWCRSCTSTVARRSRHILATAKPKVFVTTREFGRMTFQPDLCAGRPDRRAGRREQLRRAARRRAAGGHPRDRPGRTRADRLHVRHHPRPQGRGAQPPDARLRDPPAAGELSARPRQAAHRHPGRALHRHGRRVPHSRHRGRPDRPGRRLRSRPRCWR